MRLIGTAAATFLLLLFHATAWIPTCDAAITHNRLASNRLASNRLASNRLASNRLASNRLASNGLTADMESSGEILSTPEGRELYAYMMSCALRAGVDIHATIPGAPDSCPGCSPNDTPYTCQSEQCVFSGGLGLAPKWIDHKLNKKGQRWVSACLFARVNAYVTAQSISLRGNHDALTISIDEAENYSVEEGAFYGQLFTPEDEPIAAYACMGEDQASGETGALNLRDCTEPDPNDPAHTQCSFNYTGECADFSPDAPSEYACKTRKDGYYDNCHDRPGLGQWRKTKNYREVITVFVAP